MTIKLAVIVKILYCVAAVLSRIEPEDTTARESKTKRGQYSVQCCRVKPADTPPPPYLYGDTAHTAYGDTAHTAYEHFLPT
jgi:hypothetical protein